VGHFDGVRVAKLMGREPSANTSTGGHAAQVGARSGG
jgi:hypothetical protein